jgi:hypothetical protein
MKKVSFTEMKNGNKEDYQLLEKYEKDFERKTADRVIKYLAAQTTTLEGYQITRLSILYRLQQGLIKMVKAKRWL